MGAIKYVIETVDDITDRKKAEQELIGIKSKIEHLLSESASIIYSCTAEPPYGATFISENIERITGYGSQEFTKDPDFWARNIHPDEVNHIFKELSILFERGYHIHEYRWRNKDGTYIRNIYMDT